MKMYMNFDLCKIQVNFFFSLSSGDGSKVGKTHEWNEMRAGYRTAYVALAWPRTEGSQLVLRISRHCTCDMQASLFYLLAQFSACIIIASTKFSSICEYSSIGDRVFPDADSYLDIQYLAGFECSWSSARNQLMRLVIYYFFDRTLIKRTFFLFRGILENWKKDNWI